MTEGEEFKLPEGIKDPSLEFDLQDSLGKGSFGSVYKAVHKKSGHEVAIKQVLVNDDFMEILKEINFMKQCKSKYVVQYYGNYFKGDQCWIVMEYCASGSVGDILALVDTAMDEAQIALVCRNIKPGNILVNANGECKLADFGVSGQLSERTRKRNTVIGTPFFLAPEVIQEVGYDSKADIWALGISAIEMAEKHPPYYDVHPMRVLFLIPTSTPPTLKEPSKWSHEFNDFLRSCLNKDPSQRLSAKQLLKHPFIERGRDGSVMNGIINTAQSIIDMHGGSRLQALKEIQKKKMGGKGGSDDDDDSDPDSPRKVHQSDSDSSMSDSDDSSDDEPSRPQQNFTSIDELDNILNGILSKAESEKPKKPEKPKEQPKPKEQEKPKAVQAPPQKPVVPQHEDELEALLSGLQAKAKSKSEEPSNPVASPRLAPNSATPAKATPTNISSVPKTPSGGTLQSNPRLPSITSTVAISSTPQKPKNPSGNSISGQWTAANSGGCTNTSSWRINPQFAFTVPSATTIKVTLSQSEPYNAIGFYVAKASADKTKLLSLAKENTVPGSEVGFQKAKYVTVEFKADTGDYVVVPTTFLPGGEGAFELEVSGATNLQPLTKAWNEISCHGEWKGSASGGCYSGTSTTWRNNPKFTLVLSSAVASLTIILSKTDPVNVSTFVGFTYSKQEVRTTSPSGSLLASNLATKTNFVNGLEVVHISDLPAGKYVLLPCTYDPGQDGRFTVSVYSSTNVVKFGKPDEKSAVVSGGWKGAATGGCLNHPTWRANPQYLLTSSKPSLVTVMLEQIAGEGSLPFVGFYALQAPQDKKKLFMLVTKDVLSNTEFINDVQIVHSLQVDSSCIILPATFTPNVDGKFNLRVSSEDGDLTLTELPSWESSKVSGEWKGTTAGGRYSTTSNAWQSNPRFEIIPTSPAATRLALILVQSEKASLLGIGFYVFKRLPDQSLKSVLGKSGFVSGKEVAMELTLAQGESAIVVPATFEPGQNDTFSIILYSDQRCAFV